MITTLAIIVIIGGLIIMGFITVDTVITHKRLAENQREWDAFSEGMTRDEQLESICDWLIERQKQTKWDCLYIPRIKERQNENKR